MFRYRELGLSPAQRLQDVVTSIRGKICGGTDCAVPISYATSNKILVDGFIIFTDEHSWAGSSHVSQAFKAYQKALNPNARLVMVSATMSNQTLADPKDNDSLTIVGFSPDTLSIAVDFINGKM